MKDIKWLEMVIKQTFVSCKFWASVSTFKSTSVVRQDKMPWGPFINDVSSEGEGGGPPSKRIYYTRDHP